MAAAAVEVLREHRVRPAGGIVVGPAAGESPDAALEYIQGNHPEPGAGSLQAAEALGTTAALVPPDAEAWVLLSGGTSSLIAAPEPGLSEVDLSALYRLLLGSGLDIQAMNQIRKRFSRWGGGKLARALAAARIRVYVVSDVIGDDLASIGSGPCVPDPATALEVRRLLERAGLWRRIPPAARRLVISTEAGTVPETPKPGDPAFERVTSELIASNWLALEAAARRADEVGLRALVVETPIAGEASAVGAELASTLLGTLAAISDSAPNCIIWGGETTVTLSENSGLGGRCQELALSAARILDGALDGVALLAAGTDGRDGPTDAAGAIVDGRTWRSIATAGRDPSSDLAEHNAYPALDAADALLRPGHTGTNVMDVVIGLTGANRPRA
jgi:hydroxypyruvate reductase